MKSNVYANLASIPEADPDSMDHILIAQAETLDVEPTVSLCEIERQCQSFPPDKS